MSEEGHHPRQKDKQATQKTDPGSRIEGTRIKDKADMINTFGKKYGTD